MKFVPIKKRNDLIEEGVIEKGENIPPEYRDKIYESPNSVKKEREYEMDMLKSIVKLSKQLEAWNSHIKGKVSDREEINHRWKMGRTILDFYEKYNAGYVQCPNCGLKQNRVTQKSSRDSYGQGRMIRKKCEICNEDMKVDGQPYYDISEIISRMHKIKNNKIPTPDISEKARKHIQEHGYSSTTLRVFQEFSAFYPNKDDIEYYDWNLVLNSISEEIALHPKFVSEKFLSMVDNEQIVDNYIIEQEFTRKTKGKVRGYYRDAAKKLAREFEEYHNEEYSMEDDDNEWNTDKRALKEEDFEEYENQKEE